MNQSDNGPEPPATLAPPPPALLPPPPLPPLPPLPPPVRCSRDDLRYRCLCGKMHVKTAAYIIGVVESMIVAAEIIFFFAYGHSSLTGLIGTMLWTLAVVFLFLGLKQERARYLILNLVMQILQILGFFTAIGVSIYFIVTGITRKIENENYVLLGSLLLAAAILGVIFETWFIVVMVKCYRYLQEKAKVDQQTMVLQQSGSYLDAPPGYYANDFAAPIHLAPPPSYAEVTKPQETV